MIAGRQRLTRGHRALASLLAVSLVLSLFPVLVRASGHDCTGSADTTTAAVITATGHAGAGCAHAVGCGPTACCASVTPALFQTVVLRTASAVLSYASPAWDTRVPRFLLGGPPTPPPNN